MDLGGHDISSLAAWCLRQLNPPGYEASLSAARVSIAMKQYGMPQIPSVASSAQPATCPKVANPIPATEVESPQVTAELGALRTQVSDLADLVRNLFQERDLSLSALAVSRSAVANTSATSSQQTTAAGLLENIQEPPQPPQAVLLQAVPFNRDDQVAESPLPQRQSGSLPSSQPLSPMPPHGTPPVHPTPQSTRTSQSSDVTSSVVSSTGPALAALFSAVDIASSADDNHEQPQAVQGAWGGDYDYYADGAAQSSQLSLAASSRSRESSEQASTAPPPRLLKRLRKGNVGIAAAPALAAAVDGLGVSNRVLPGGRIDGVVVGSPATSELSGSAMHPPPSRRRQQQGGTGTAPGDRGMSGGALTRRRWAVVAAMESDASSQCGLGPLGGISLSISSFAAPNDAPPLQRHSGLGPHAAAGATFASRSGRVETSSAAGAARGMQPVLVQRERSLHQPLVVPTQSEDAYGHGHAAAAAAAAAVGPAASGRSRGRSAAVASALRRGASLSAPRNKSSSAFLAAAAAVHRRARSSDSALMPPTGFERHGSSARVHASGWGGPRGTPPPPPAPLPGQTRATFLRQNPLMGGATSMADNAPPSHRREYLLPLHASADHSPDHPAARVTQSQARWKARGYNPGPGHYVPGPSRAAADVQWQPRSDAAAANGALHINATETLRFSQSQPPTFASALQPGGVLQSQSIRFGQSDLEPTEQRAAFMPSGWGGESMPPHARSAASAAAPATLVPLLRGPAAFGFSDVRHARGAADGEVALPMQNYSSVAAVEAPFLTVAKAAAPLSSNASASATATARLVRRRGTIEADRQADDGSAGLDSQPGVSRLGGASPDAPLSAQSAEGVTSLFLNGAPAEVLRSGGGLRAAGASRLLPTRPPSPSSNQHVRMPLLAADAAWGSTNQRFLPVARGDGVSKKLHWDGALSANSEGSFQHTQNGAASSAASSFSQQGHISMSFSSDSDSDSSDSQSQPPVTRPKAAVSAANASSPSTTPATSPHAPPSADPSASVPPETFESSIRTAPVPRKLRRLRHGAVAPAVARISARGSTPAVGSSGSKAASLSESLRDSQGGRNRASGGINGGSPASQLTGTEAVIAGATLFPAFAGESLSKKPNRAAAKLPTRVGPPDAVHSLITTSSTRTVSPVRRDAVPLISSAGSASPEACSSSNISSTADGSGSLHVQPQQLVVRGSDSQVSDPTPSFPVALNQAEMRPPAPACARPPSPTPAEPASDTQPSRLSDPWMPTFTAMTPSHATAALPLPRRHTAVAAKRKGAANSIAGVASTTVQSIMAAVTVRAQPKAGSSNVTPSTAKAAAAAAATKAAAAAAAHGLVIKGGVTFRPRASVADRLKDAAALAAAESALNAAVAASTAMAPASKNDPPVTVPEATDRITKRTQSRSGGLTALSRPAVMGDSPEGKASRPVSRVWHSPAAAASRLNDATTENDRASGRAASASSDSDPRLDSSHNFGGNKSSSSSGSKTGSSIISCSAGQSALPSSSGSSIAASSSSSSNPPSEGPLLPAKASTPLHMGGLLPPPPPASSGFALGMLDDCDLAAAAAIAEEEAAVLRLRAQKSILASTGSRARDAFSFNALTSALSQPPCSDNGDFEALDECDAMMFQDAAPILLAPSLSSAASSSWEPMASPPVGATQASLSSESFSVSGSSRRKAHVSGAMGDESSDDRLPFPQSQACASVISSSLAGSSNSIGQSRHLSSSSSEQSQRRTTVAAAHPTGAIANRIAVRHPGTTTPFVAVRTLPVTIVRTECDFFDGDYDDEISP